MFRVGYNADINQVGTYIAGMNTEVDGMSYWGVIVSFSFSYSGNNIFGFQIYRRWGSEAIKTRMYDGTTWSAWV